MGGYKQSLGRENHPHPPLSPLSPFGGIGGILWIPVGDDRGSQSALN